MKLYGYWRSSAAYRVRIAMHLKGLAFESIPVHLVKDGGEQHKRAYTDLNPTHLVPTLVDEDVTHDGVQPAFDVGTLLEVVFVTQCLHHRILNQIFSILHVTRKPKCKTF